MACYIGIGWIIVIAIRPTIQAITIKGILLLVIGGISYTIGAVLYGLGRKIRYMHTVFHVFVLLGTMFHFLAVFIYCVLR